MGSVRLFVSIIRSAYEAFSADKAPRLGAAIAFYTLFSLAPLLLVATGVASLVLGPLAAQNALHTQIASLVGPQGAVVVSGFLGGAYRTGGSRWMTIAGTGTMLIGAGNLFAQLQDALNSLWGVQAKPGLGWGFLLRQRAIAFFLVLVLSAFLLASLLLSLLLGTAARLTQAELPLPEGSLQGLNFLTDFVAVFALLAVIFKVLPYVQIGWRDVWAGAALTALIFSLGKLVLAWYLGRPSLTALYGPAGDLVVLLLWVYYATQIVFFGVEFTRVYANRCGTKIEPASFAEFVTSPALASPVPAVEIPESGARTANDTRPVSPGWTSPWEETFLWTALGLAVGLYWSWRRRE